MLEQGLTCLSKVRTLSDPIYQANFESLLKLLHLMSNSGLRQIQCLGGGGEVAAGDNLSVMASPSVPGSRKTVTVVFCDLSESVALGERLDPERLHQVLSRYYEAVAGVLEAHGATVEKFIGDAAVAIFGAVKHWRRGM